MRCRDAPPASYAAPRHSPTVPRASKCADNVLGVHLDVLFHIEMYALPRFCTSRCTAYLRHL